MSSTPSRFEDLERQVAELEGDPTTDDVVVDRRTWRAIRVHGGDAERWLNDLLTAELAGLPIQGAARSLLLTPTGRIRADVHVYRRADDFVIVQDPAQPRAIDELLAPYVLSSDVELSPSPIGPICAPRAEGLQDGSTFAPSILGSGTDLLADPGDADVGHSRTPISQLAVDIWRIRHGTPTFGVDLDEDSLPAEAGLDDPARGVIDATKGCYLGQESVAKIRNFGHPQRAVVAMRADGAVDAGTPVDDSEKQVGLVTSSASLPAGGRALIVRIRWGARDADLKAAQVPLRHA
ncbi:MAG: hypothetical protein WEA10_03035 [Actinomycetota bacterium]